MGRNVAPMLSNFNAGELSPLMDGRIDIAKYGNGCYRMENFIPTVQGPGKRRMGFRFVSEVRNSAERTWLYRFVFAQDQAFQLEFSPNKLRFYINHGLLLDGPDPYEIDTPWSVSELTNPDGTFKLSLAQTGDVVFIASGSVPLQQLTRLGDTNWTLTDADVKGGPFIDVDPDNPVTLYASAATGTGITLTASAAIFTAPMVGTLFLIEQPRVDEYKAWEVNKVISAGAYRRSDSNVYRALNAATTGTIKPTHRDGAKFDGDTGVQWEYVHSGYGIVRITAAAGTTATADVIDELPSTVIGSSNPTNRWAPAGWRSDLGYPTLVTFFRERLTLFRKASGWFSVAADFLNFANRDGAETLPDSAIRIDITTAELNDCTFLVPAKRLLVGTVGAEFAIGELSTSDVFGPGNVSASLQTGHGSRQIPPVIVNDSALFVQKTGRRLRDLRYSFDADGYDTTDLQVLSTDIARGQMIQTCFQEEPDNVMWAACQNGELIGFTFNREQDVLGWHRHPFGAGIVVESVSTIPSPDGSQDELWAILRLTVDGTSRRYVAYLDKDWRADEATLEDCLYSDLGATFSGMDQPGTVDVDAAFTGPGSEGTLICTDSLFAAGDVDDWVVIEASTAYRCRFQILEFTNASTVIARQLDDFPPGFSAGDTSADWAFARDVISGLDYLEGLEVSVLGDGAAHPNRTVADGAITLQRRVRVAQVGIPMVAEIETMRIEAGSENGTAQGKTKRIHRLTLRFFETLGCTVGAFNEAGNFVSEQVLFRDSSMPMNQPPAVFTGDKSLLFPEGYTMDARIVVRADQPLPMTLVALMPQMATQDRG